MTASPLPDSFLERVRTRATAMGRPDLEDQWSLAVRDMEFPLTPAGYKLLADPWKRWGDIASTDAIQGVVRWLVAPPAQQSCGLFLYGPPGSGKSFAAAFLCVVRHVTRTEGGSFPAWCQGAAMSTRVLFDKDVNLTARTFVLDDLGAGNVTEASKSALEVVLDQRGKPGRVIVLTSNGMPQACQDAYGARNSSRIRGIFGEPGSLVCCEGKDLR